MIRNNSGMSRAFPIPDGEIARTYGMNILSVHKKRVSRGIRCYARKSKTWHYWTKKEIALLGKMPDGDVALRTGINKASVASGYAGMNCRDKLAGQVLDFRMERSDVQLPETRYHGL